MDQMKTHEGIAFTVLSLALAGCLVPTAQPDDNDTGSTTSTSSSSTSTTAATTEPENPSGPEMTQPNPSSADSDSDTTTSADEPSGASEDTTGASGQPNGYYPCLSDDECMSGNCFDMGALNGICSECNADEDCADITGFGCNPPDIANPVLPAVCGDGELGAGCEDATACADGLTCELVLSIPLVHEFTHCSACTTHDDCSGDELCSVTIDITTISGFWSCLEPGSVEIGGTCDHDGDGDQVCASGNCAEADIDNLAFMGLCSECDEDSDCLEGWHCQDADIKTANVVAVPAVCVQD